MSVVVKCSATTKKGDPCRYKAKVNGLCGIHAPKDTTKPKKAKQSPSVQLLEEIKALQIAIASELGINVEAVLEKLRVEEPIVVKKEGKGKEKVEEEETFIAEEVQEEEPIKVEEEPIIAEEEIKEKVEEPIKVEEEVKVEEPIIAEEEIKEKVEEPIKVEEEKVKVEEPIVKEEEKVKVEEPIIAEEEIKEKVEEPIKVEEEIKVEEPIVKEEVQEKVEEPIVKNKIETEEEPIVREKALKKKNKKPIVVKEKEPPKKKNKKLIIVKEKEPPKKKNKEGAVLNVALMRKNAPKRCIYHIEGIIRCKENSIDGSSYCSKHIDPICCNILLPSGRSCKNKVGIPGGDYCPSCKEMIEEAEKQRREEIEIEKIKEQKHKEAREFSLTSMKPLFG